MPDPLAFPQSRFNVIVAQLEANHYLEIICEGCSRQGRLSPEDLRARFAPEMEMRDIAKKVRCRSCRRKGSRYWDVRAIRKAG